LDENIKSEVEDIIIAVENDKIMGFIHIAEEKTLSYACFIPHKYAVIVDLYVQEAHRQRGVGTRLLEAAKQWAQARGLDYLELNVLAENENGIQFYRHQKFNMVSQIMRLPLNGSPHKASCAVRE
jgi:ribosomal protein S18 acetylase RimI-like enzyme